MCSFVPFVAQSVAQFVAESVAQFFATPASRHLRSAWHFPGVATDYSIDVSMVAVGINHFIV